MNADRLGQGRVPRGGRGLPRIACERKPLCANDFADHLALAFDHVALREVLNALDPSTAQAPDCSRTVLPLIGG